MYYLVVYTGAGLPRNAYGVSRGSAKCMDGNSRVPVTRRLYGCWGGPNEGPSAPSVITSPSYRIEDSSAEGPLGPTVTHPLATASKTHLLKVY